MNLLLKWDLKGLIYVDIQLGLTSAINSFIAKLIDLFFDFCDCTNIKIEEN